MAANTIVVNVRTLPDALESEMYPHLTRFQRKQSETRGPALRLQFAPDETLGALKKRIEQDRGYPVESLRKGGTPEGIVLEPDTATLTELNITTMSIWEHIWEDTTANQTQLQKDREQIRGAVVDFMEDHPTVGRHGPEVTGEPGEFPEGWDAKQRKKRAEMEKAIATVREDKQRKEEFDQAKKNETSKAEGQKTPDPPSSLVSAATPETPETLGLDAEAK